MWKIGIDVRKDMTAVVLRKKARGEKDGRVVARMMGIANILDGMDRTSAAKAAGMDRQTLCDWVHRYNQDGLAGLCNRPRGRPERLLTPEQEKNFAANVAKILPEHALGKLIEFWFQDEARVGQKGTLTHIWAKCGTRPRPRNLLCVEAGNPSTCCSRTVMTTPRIVPFPNNPLKAGVFNEMNID